jgi:hypothetical protein
MTMSIDDVRKSRGRPPVGATPVTVRMPPTDLAALDEWIGNQPDPKPSRPEAMRQHVKRSLDHCGSAGEASARSTVPHEVTGRDKS